MENTSNLERTDKDDWEIMHAKVWQATAMHRGIRFTETIVTLAIRESENTYGFYVGAALNISFIYERIIGSVMLRPRAAYEDVVFAYLKNEGAEVYYTEHEANAAHMAIVERLIEEGHQIEKIRWDARNYEWVVNE